MLSASDRITELFENSPQTGFPAGSALPSSMVAEALSIVSDKEFVRLPVERQSALLDFIQAAYITTYDRSAPAMACALQGVFQSHLRDDRIPLGRLMKTYDLLYFLYWCASTSIEEQRGFDTHVVAPFSRRLRAGRRQVSTAPLRQGGRVRVCYLSQFAYSGGGNALAAVMEAVLGSVTEYCSGRYELFVYAWMYKDREFVERIRALGVTVREFDLSGYSEKELMRLRQSFFDDRIEVALTDMNSAAPHYLFERRVAPVQVFYQLGLPFWSLQNLDAVFQGWDIAPASLGLRAQQCHPVPAPKSFRDINPPITPERIQEERRRFPQAECVIGFYGRLVKVTPEFCDIVRRVLDRHPGVIAILGGTGDALPIRRFVDDRNLSERLFVVNEFVDGHVWGHILDIFLDTFPLAGGYSCREVMAKAKPIVHMRSDEMPNLSDCLDIELEACGPDEYVARTSRLIENAAAYRRACDRARAISRQQSDLRPFAEAFDAALQAVLASPASSGQTHDPFRRDFAKTLAEAEIAGASDSMESTS